VDVTVVREWINLATVPPLRNPTRLTAARKKKPGCSGRDDKSGKGAQPGIIPQIPRDGAEVAVPQALEI